MRPQARRSGLLIRDLGDERLVYDLERHEAHCLNPSAAAVFEACDGRASVEELTLRLRRQLGPGVDGAWVSGALDGLSRAHLVTGDGHVAPSARASAGRRELLRQVGVGAALLLPAVVSLAVPTPAEAAATCVPESACSSNPGSPCYPALSPDPEGDCQACTCVGSTCVCGP